MKKFLSTALTSLIFLAVGICLILKPASSADFACHIAGSVCLAVAVIKFVSALLNNTLFFHMIPCIFLAGLGIVLVSLKASILSILPIIIGICFLFYGLVKLSTAFMIKSFSKTAFFKLLVSSLIGIAFAIIIIVLHDFARDVVFRLIGVLLVYNSIESIFSEIVSKPLSRGSKDNTKKNEIHAEFEDAE